MLDINSNKKQIFKYLIMSIFFLVLAMIYESFSHGVFSPYMVFAFLIPLLMGFLIYSIIYCTKINNFFSAFSTKIFNSAILTFTIGSVIKGVLDIYGTTNNLVYNYFGLGVVLLIISIVINIKYNIKRKGDIKNEK